jgi:hypothetical protein
MRRAAWIYIYAVLLSASIAGLAAALLVPSENPGWLFWSLTTITAIMRVSVIDSPRHRAYEGSTIALMAGILLLPPGQFVLQVILAHLAEWGWVRLRMPESDHLRAWYIQPFNMAKCILGGAAALLLIWGLRLNLQGQTLSAAPIAALLVITTYVMVNQLLLGFALKLARGLSLRQAGIFRDALLTELPFACIGFFAF